MSFLFIGQNSDSCCHNPRADLSPTVVKGTFLQAGHESREVLSEKHIMSEQARHWHALKITNRWQALPQSHISTPNLAGFFGMCMILLSIILWDSTRVTVAGSDLLPHGKVGNYTV